MKNHILSILLLAVSFSTAAQTRIMVFSDPHVMHTSLFDGGSAFATYRDGETKLVEHSLQLFDSAIHLVLSEQPDLLLIPGDLTKDGELASHTYVHSRLQELLHAGIHVLVVPGNHDIACPAAYSYIGAKKTRVPNISAQQFDSIYSDCGAGTAVMRMTGSLSYMAYPLPGLAIICMNSCLPNTSSRQSHGGLNEAAIAFVDSAAHRAFVDGRTPILMMHHPLMEHFSHHAEEASSYIANSLDSFPSLDTLQQHLLHSGIEMAFTGHYHIHSAQQITLDDTLSFSDISTGSLCSYPSPIRRITIARDGQVSVSSSTFPDYHDLEQLRNINTAKGAIRTLARKLYPKMQQVQEDLPTLSSKFIIPDSLPQLIDMCNEFLLPPYTDLINTLSHGDEEFLDPQTKYDACIDSLDSFFMYICRGSKVYFTALKSLTFITGYYSEYKEMCHSVFFNYVDDEERWYPDATITLQLSHYYSLPVSPEPDALTSIGNVTSAAKHLREGQILITTPEGTFSSSGRLLQ